MLGIPHHVQKELGKRGQGNGPHCLEQLPSRGDKAPSLRRTQPRAAGGALPPPCSNAASVGARAEPCPAHWLCLPLSICITT